MLFINKLSWLHPTVLLLLVGVADADTLRYRGEYTYGHEVNTFCPSINSQCYWLSNDSDKAALVTLQALSAVNTAKPYQPLCVVLEGEIDRDTARSGFAADYDGLITVSKVLGPCESTRTVTQGDLQHHRWVLQSIDGKALDTTVIENQVPDLDFGEQMHVSGNSGCNRFSGQAKLDGDTLDFGHMISTAMACPPPHNEVESIVLRVLGSQPVVSLDDDKALTLKSVDTVLLYHLRDWVQ